MLGLGRACPRGNGDALPCPEPIPILLYPTPSISPGKLLDSAKGMATNKLNTLKGVSHPSPSATTDPSSVFNPKPDSSPTLTLVCEMCLEP